MARVTYLPRSFWTTAPPAGHPLPHTQINQLVVHHTVFILSDYDGDGFTKGDLDDIRAYMVRLSTIRPDLGNDVPYSFVHFLGADDDEGIVVEGRGWDRTGAHTLNYNSKVYGCAFAGNSNVQAATPGLIASYRFIGSQLPNPLNAGRTMGHKDIGITQCPGDSLYAHMGQLQPPFLPLPAEEPDVKPSLTFQMRDNDDPRVYLVIDNLYKERQYGDDSPHCPRYVDTCRVTGLPNDLSLVEAVTPEALNKLKDLVDDIIDF